jgi:hypothetical protein
LAWPRRFESATNLGPADEHPVAWRGGLGVAASSVAAAKNLPFDPLYFTSIE